jgi:hypothetical protein
VGANPLFPPHHPKGEEAREALLYLLHQGPQAFQQSGTRWQLASILSACPWLRLKSRPGLSRLFKRLKISWKRARAHVHSPDLNYRTKLADVRLWVLHHKADLEELVIVFEDEFSLYRHPSLSWEYAPLGHEQPSAEMGHKSNYVWRIAGALNALTGKVTFLDCSHLDIAHMTRFYRQIVADYPAAEEIKLVQDNWPIHYHPDLLAALQEQDFPYGVYRPANWPTEPKVKTPHLQLPITILSLPTYAPWTNPIEKLWRFLYQEILHLHRFEDDWGGLKRAVQAFLEQFAQGSPDLLRYVGLSDRSSLYRALFPAK